MTCYGIDASHYNSLSQDGLNSAKQAGTLWFTHKASEGTSMRDDQFAKSINWAKNAGLYVGSYHVIRSSPSVDSQGNYFLDAISKGYDWRADPTFIFQVDLEKWSYDSVSASQGTNFAQWLLDNTGRKAVFLYASKGQYGDSLHTPVDLWNANYPTWEGDSCPSQDFKTSYAHSGGDTGKGWASYSGRKPVFWQYSDNATFGRLYGLDANAYLGTEADFAALVGGTVTSSVAEEDMGMLAQDPATQHVYLCIGFQSYFIANPDHLGDIQYLSKQGAYSIARAPANANPAEWTPDGWIRLGWSPDLFGPVAGTVTLTDDQIQLIAEQVADAINDQTGLTYDDTVEAARQALTEGALLPAPTRRHRGTHSGQHAGYDAETSD